MAEETFGSRVADGKASLAEVVIITVVAAMILSGIGAGCRGIWYSRLVYSFRLNVPYDNVYVDQEPSDCQWMRSPLGNKACHFEASVEIECKALAPHKGTIISHNNGHTWTQSPRDGPLSTLPDTRLDPNRPEIGSYSLETYNGYKKGYKKAQVWVTWYKMPN